MAGVIQIVKLSTKGYRTPWPDNNPFKLIHTNTQQPTHNYPTYKQQFSPIPEFSMRKNIDPQAF